MVNHETWVKIPWADYYEVSTLGRVRSIDRKVVDSLGRVMLRRGVELKQSLRKPKPSGTRPAKRAQGHLAVSIYVNGKIKRTPVHQIVLESFCGERPSGMECRHLNGDASDNRLENLRWGTRSENQLDSVLHGTKPIGERAQQSKLSCVDVDFIRFWLRSGFTMASIAEAFNVSDSNIDAINSGRIWKHHKSPRWIAVAAAREVSDD